MNIGNFRACNPRNYMIEWKDPSRAAQHFYDVVQVETNGFHQERESEARIVTKDGSSCVVNLDEALFVTYGDVDP